MVPIPVDDAESIDVTMLKMMLMLIVGERGYEDIIITGVLRMMVPLMMRVKVEIGKSVM